MSHLSYGADKQLLHIDYAANWDAEYVSCVCAMPLCS